MMLLEHDAKQLLAERGLPVPAGRLLRRGDPIEGDGPVMVKAQVPVGGRGKAGGIKLARDGEEIEAALAAILGMTIKGHEVRACRIEQPVDHVAEAYLSLSIDAGPGNVRLLVSAEGGVDIEAAASDGALLSAAADPDPASVRAAFVPLAGALPERLRGPVLAAGLALTDAFFAHEAILLEVNPLFVRADGSWMIGDAKMVVDDNGFPRQQRLRRLVLDQADLYREAALKLEQDYDFVRLDADGDIGLVTTGAGLSMQLVDELTARGRRPFNFCDIRTGQFRGDPARLIQVLSWIAEGRSIRAVLFNFFAGHTDLGEIARLLLIALDAVPQLRAPITARFIGNGLEQAKAILEAAGAPIVIETDLERAIDLAIARADAWQPDHG